MVLFNEKGNGRYFVDSVDGSSDFDERNHSLDEILSIDYFGFRLTEGFKLLDDDDPVYGEESMF
ncbi:hypothetical protein CVU83_01500 [Candidatus Falkowbacteria bacterium HGW-Falkowbacteria-2]|uniref:Uncharacterized protein n=1 Tax=Candidatus Falkowbacteria bacterium HGW-Falkowbacteria-2 TaxID=2013769 RepID=A0A2N2E1L4_9BACT|nr:MAG: hypothetical protein CVU83_01500 [Candidatus Falkowbacteria bacterium HGW-Falkowbacteria-2]